ncbi:MAG: TIGR00159 family protein, partial [Firmicutes bacterium]|nr:TIGR00159 family protein [Bacillota bacterium]
MAQFLEALTRAITWRSILDIAIVSYVFYKAIVVIRGTRAEQLVKGLAVLLIATVVSRELQLFAFNWMLNNLMTVGIVAIPIVFQPELRRGLETLGRGKIFTRTSQVYGDIDFDTMLAEIIKAVQVMVKRRIGALIILER